jgi:ferritin
MLITKKMNAALNEQIGNEFAASLQYVSIASYFASESLMVLADHFFKQADEERGHALRLLKYVIDAGGRAEIPAIPAPRTTFASAEEVVQLSVDSENKVTKQINALVAQAIQESDYISQNILAWFTTEQLEEISSMETLLKLVQRAGPSGLIYVENYLVIKSQKGAMPDGLQPS